MELKDYWLIVRRRWPIILGTVVVAVLAAVVVTLQTTPLYSSSAAVFVATDSSDIGQAAQGGQFATQRVASYADLVPKNRTLAEQVAEDIGGDVAPSVVQEEVSADVVPETVNLEITATDPSPVRARDIAQAYAERLSDLVAAIETPDDRTTAPIRAEIVDNAEVSTDPVSPQPVRNIGLALALGLLLGAGLATARELLDTTLKSPDDLDAITASPMLGQITVDPSAVRLSPADALAGTSQWAESFRVLRTNMQYVEVDHDHKVFVVTSSMPSEGKSTTAVNLAITMALADQRVALVECDLRRPLIAKRMGLDGAVGTTSVLIGKVGLEEALQPYGDTGLDVLACGPIPPNPSELLQSLAMDTLLKQLGSDYDVVLLDAPPLLPVTDAALLAAQADGALVIVRHGRTRQEQLSHAIERLAAVDAKTLGVVFNMVPTRGAGSTYGYGYGYEPLNDAADRRGLVGRLRGTRTPRPRTRG